MDFLFFFINIFFLYSLGLKHVYCLSTKLNIPTIYPISIQYGYYYVHIYIREEKNPYLFELYLTFFLTRISKA